MSIAKPGSALKSFRNFLFSALNKEFFIFLGFLALSGAFWLIMTLNETFDREVLVVTRLEGIPQKVVVTTETEDTLHVTLRDKGYNLLRYVYRPNLMRFSVKFSSFDKGNGKVQVSNAELLKLLYGQISRSTKITQLKPDRMEYLYNYGTSKRVPVKLNGKVEAGESYYIANVRFKPDQVLVYALDEKLDSVKQVYTTKLNLTQLTDTIQQVVSLQKVRGVKCVPAQVELFIYPDILTEASVEVPIVAVNMPAGKRLRTFPQKVKVFFVTGASTLKGIHVEQFRLEADYNDIITHPSDKCHIRVVGSPRGVRNSHPEVSQVDYLIEEQ